MNAPESRLVSARNVSAGLRHARAVLLLAAAIGGVTLLAGPSRSDALPAGEPVSAVVARGRIEPVGRVRLISGPSTGGTVAELRVVEGERVAAGQVLALLDTHARESAAVEIAERELRLAMLQRSQTAAGAKASDIAAQRAVVAARRAELERSTRQLRRSQDLVEQRFISGEALDLQQMDTQRARENLQQATATLAALSEVRGVDLQVAEGRVEQARARLAHARAQLALTEIRAPAAGTVLAIYGRAGSALATEGLLRMADLGRLIVVAEVNEFDAPRLAAGQDARVTVRGLNQPLNGRLDKVLGLVAVNERPTTDVLRGRDARVVEAEVSMLPGQTLPAFVGTEVTVSIDTRRAQAR